MLLVSHSEFEWALSWSRGIVLRKVEFIRKKGDKTIESVGPRCITERTAVEPATKVSWEICQQSAGNSWNQAGPVTNCPPTCNLRVLMSHSSEAAASLLPYSFHSFVLGRLPRFCVHCMHTLWSEVIWTLKQFDNERSDV